MAAIAGAAFAYAGTAAGAATITAGAAVAGAGISAYSAYSASQAGKNARAGQQQQVVAPVKTQAAIDPSATRSSNANSAMAGIPGTLLTGASGVNPNSLNLGRTLLGS